MVEERKSETTSEWAAAHEVAKLLGMKAETLRRWIRRAEIDDGRRPGLTTSERERLQVLEKENQELRRANEILRDASAFFAAELDGRTRR
jgi:transposase